MANPRPPVHSSSSSSSKLNSDGLFFSRFCSLAPLLAITNTKLKDEEEGEILTEFTLSCARERKRKKSADAEISLNEGKNHAGDKEYEEEEGEISTELTLSCACGRKRKEPTKAENSLDKQKKNQTLDEQEEGKKGEISTELILFSCSSSIVSKKPTKSESNSCDENSTILTLYDNIWNVERKEPIVEMDFLSNSSFSTLLQRTKQGPNIIARNHTNVQKRMMELTRLQLYESPWKIKKRLNKSDIGGCSRLLLGVDLVREYILPNFDAVRAAEIASDEGANVVIWDEDTESEHQLTFKRWSSTRSYIFNGNWREEFVTRRDLNEGDEIGLYWDRYNFRFSFCVLNRA